MVKRWATEITSYLIKTRCSEWHAGVVHLGKIQKDFQGIVAASYHHIYVPASFNPRLGYHANCRTLHSRAGDSWNRSYFLIDWLNTRPRAQLAFSGHFQIDFPQFRVGYNLLPFRCNWPVKNSTTRANRLNIADLHAQCQTHMLSNLTKHLSWCFSSIIGPNHTRPGSGLIRQWSHRCSYNNRCLKRRGCGQPQNNLQMESAHNNS